MLTRINKYLNEWTSTLLIIIRKNHIQNIAENMTFHTKTGLPLSTNQRTRHVQWFSGLNFASSGFFSRAQGIDPDRQAIYIVFMTNDNPTQIAELELKKLENRIDELIHVCNRLTEENRDLRTQQEQISADRKQLLKKNEHVRTRVEAMITRLRSMEKHS